MDSVKSKDALVSAVTGTGIVFFAQSYIGARTRKGGTVARFFSLVLIVGLAVGTSSWLVAQSTGTSKRPLDLPAGKFGKDEEDQEDESETIIFYGQEYEADAFFWCMDRSCSMGWGGLMAVLKQEVTSSIQSLTGRAEFGLVAFSGNTSVWQHTPQKATVAQKAAGIAWVQQLNPDGATCMAAAGVKAVEICNLSRKRNKAVILLSDGAPNCPACGETITAITGANWQRNPINTLFIGSGAGGASCMQQLASANNGSFAQVQ